MGSWDVEIILGICVNVLLRVEKEDSKILKVKCFCNDVLYKYIMDWVIRIVNEKNRYMVNNLEIFYIWIYYYCVKVLFGKISGM